MGVLAGLDRVQRRHRALGVPVAVLYKYLDDHGAYLAALIAFYAFVSIFPLFLIMSSVLGIVLGNSPELQERLIDSAMSQLPLIGQQIERREFSGSRVVVTVGAVGALLGALAVATAVQHALNVVWSVRRHQRPNPVLVRVRSLFLLILLGVFVVATTALAQLSPALAVIDTPLGTGAQVGAQVGAYVLAVATFVVICRFGTVASVPLPRHLPGALIAGGLWLLLQSAGTSFVGAYISRTSVTEGVFGIVLGLLLWLYLAAMALVLCLEINVVLARRLYPRALLRLTDDVDLTHADRRALEHLAAAQSLRGFQSVEVSFEHDGLLATARRERLRVEGQEVDERATEGGASPTHPPPRPPASAAHEPDAPEPDPHEPAPPRPDAPAPPGARSSARRAAPERADRLRRGV